MSFTDQLKKILQKAGLTESESLVYLSLLNQPQSTRWDLIQETGLNKSKVYRACEKLLGLNLIKKAKLISAQPLSSLIDHLNQKKIENQSLIQQLKQISPLQKLPLEAFEEVSIASTKEKIMEQYMQMAQVNYDTCLDFGDLEGFVSVLGGLDPVFKFRYHRYKQNAKNIAFCTTIGPYTACMARKSDMQRFKSRVKTLNLNYKNRWIIFSDSSDYLMINDFSNPQLPTSLLLRSKLLADQQRESFSLFQALAKK